MISQHSFARYIPIQLVLVLSTAIIITARPNIPHYERIRKYRYSVEEVTTSKTSQEPHSSATYKTTTSLLSTTTTEGNDYHNQQLLYPTSSNINHISYDDYIHLTCQQKDPLTLSSSSCLDYLLEESNTSSSESNPSHDNHTSNTNKLHRNFLRIPTSVSASKVILESVEELSEDYLFESYIYS